METLPKGVPSYVRANYQYFTFPAIDPTDRGGGPHSDSATTSSASSAPFLRSPDDGEDANVSDQDAKFDSETEARNAYDDVASPLSRSGPTVDIERGEGDAGHGAEVVDHNESEFSRGALQRDHRDDEGRVAGVAMAAVATYTLEDCSVCLEGYLPGDRVCRLPCAHVFHVTVRPAETILIYFSSNLGCATLTTFRV